jgi:glucose/arabinose dehydrogenase
MTSGQQYMVSVTMRNTGGTTWTAAAAYRLGAINPYDNMTWGGFNRVGLAAGDSIAPGQQKTFTFSVIAPSQGTYNFQWRMVQDGVTWFGAESTNVVVQVAASRNAAFVSQSVPTAMTAGQSYNVSVTMRNTGGTTWTANALYRLGAINPYDNFTWGGNRVGLAAGDVIAPNQTKTFTFTVRAPTAPGNYNFQWRMVQDGVAWFGSETPNVVVGTGGGPNAVFVRQSVPAPMTGGQRYAVSVTMRNTGATAWTAAQLYRLGAINPYDNFTWGANRMGLAPGDTIMPGQEKTFTATVTAPMGPGTSNFQWRMVQDGVAWFGAESPNIPINTGPVNAGGASLLFFGTGSGDIDRVKIRLDAPPRPVDVGGDFTIEWWMKTAAGNTSGACTAGGDNWINGNILFDRDVFNNGDFGDFGISLFGSGGRLAFGVNRLGIGTTICGTINVANNVWHHVAATRNATTGQIRLFVDGQPDGAIGSGPTGDVSYRDGRATSFPNSDPFLVIGAEKRDAGAQFPSYHGWIDEVRVSRVVRYTASFTRPSAPFVSDANTVALYHFDEGNGNVITDASGAAGGPSTGVRRVGGTSQGPQWSTDVPFANPAPSITLQQLMSGLSGPTSITHAGDGRLFITEQPGRIRIWTGTQLLPTPFLTISPITSGGEEGLLSVAFHPQYTQNGFFYVYYNDALGNVVIARYRVRTDDPNVADPFGGVILLTIPHPAGNHNGGQLQFGPDGYLYAGIGDGGGGCDNAGAGCNAQRDSLLLGKLLRLDVNQNVNTPPYYGIPPTNPFIGAGDPRDEIWAKGLRNPWRFAFDRLSGSLFIADVGQNTKEEVDYRPNDSPGGENYGWKRMEGFSCGTCSDLSDCTVTPPPCNDPSLTLPILDYDHSLGCSITGGYVYRGVQIPALYGKYLYGDLCSGRLWWATHNGGSWTATQFTQTAGGLYTFGQDVNGELYVGQGNGTVSKIRPGP